MSEKANKRSGMLGTIYCMLPGINDDYAAKLVYTLENKKTLPQLQQDIADIAAQLGSDCEAADTIVAQILLDEITLPAALKQLRVFNNAASIIELGGALETQEEDVKLLLSVYASFASRQYFDAAFAAALKDVQDQPIPDAEKARHGLRKLVEQARETEMNARSVAKNNKKTILKLADQYRLQIKTTAELVNLYTQPATVDFEREFHPVLQELQQINEDARLSASLAAKVLLWRITPKDAQAISELSKRLHGQILEDDLMIIACRYLKVKTPQDILDTFDAVLKKLPHVSQKEENLGLAVKVLLDGTAATFEKAQQKAALRRERIMLRKNLAKKEIYSGYEYDLADKFAGHKTLAQIERETDELLNSLPHCVDKKENKELACKVLLGTLSHAEAKEQAQYLRDVKAKTLTQGLAPEAMKNYLGTKTPEELIAFFETALAPYTFWKSDRAAHEFAMQVLVGELNGTYNRQISQFTLDMMENGSSVELMSDMLSNIQTKKTSKEELDALLEMYKSARAASKEA